VLFPHSHARRLLHDAIKEQFEFDFAQVVLRTPSGRKLLLNGYKVDVSANAGVPVSGNGLECRNELFNPPCKALFLLMKGTGFDLLLELSLGHGCPALDEAAGVINDGVNMIHVFDFGLTKDNLAKFFVVCPDTCAPSDCAGGRVIVEL